LQRPMDCHERGSILVAAVFEAFFDVYIRRAANAFQIYRSAGGIEREDLTSPLADALCEVATRTAGEFFSICARAVDYLPPVDVTFGDFLRAVMTSEADFDPSDAEGIQDAWMQAFRKREILPNDATFFSMEGLRFEPFPDVIQVPNLPFGGPLGLTYEEQQRTAKALVAFIDVPANKRALGLNPRLPYRIPSFHPVYRVNHKGSIRWDLVVEVVQTSTGSSHGYPLRGGTTMILSTHDITSGGPKGLAFLRYAICKPIGGPEGARRAQEHVAYFQEQGIKRNLDAESLRINFALLHGDD
jgi:hypothetical protein